VGLSLRLVHCVPCSLPKARGSNEGFTVVSNGNDATPPTNVFCDDQAGGTLLYRLEAADQP
jgi:hypothetical protein